MAKVEIELNLMVPTNLQISRALKSIVEALHGLADMEPGASYLIPDEDGKLIGQIEIMESVKPKLSPAKLDSLVKRVRETVTLEPIAEQPASLSDNTEWIFSGPRPAGNCPTTGEPMISARLTRKQQPAPERWECGKPDGNCSTRQVDGECESVFVHKCGFSRRVKA